ncbi:uncharacterized protein LOC124711359 [Schistocerca piceifrons]|uniref:uncharacterized protein LOC124711359 n=1 Tax=Schistocerca piceifrons TaxID=274613 RepID=UPI001F5FE4B4|nr:uncharacterized protein LOC124711359 [Schistocerca piceifrons]
MPCIWKPGKNARQKIYPERMKGAVMQVIERGESVRKAAKDLNLDRKTLGRYVEKGRSGQEMNFQVNHVSNQIFTMDQKADLMNYLIQASKLNYGLTPIQAIQTTGKIMKQQVMIGSIISCYGTRNYPYELHKLQGW